MQVAVTFCLKKDSIKLISKLLVRHPKHIISESHVCGLCYYVICSLSPVVLSEADAGVLFAQAGQSGSSLQLQTHKPAVLQHLPHQLLILVQKHLCLLQCAHAHTHDMLRAIPFLHFFCPGSAGSRKTDSDKRSPASQHGSLMQTVLSVLSPRDDNKALFLSLQAMTA